MNKPQSLNWLWALALGGYIPFAFLAVSAAMDLTLPFGVSAVAAFLVWSLVILTFLGGIRWGMALTQEPLDLSSIILSVVPCIIGWFALVLEPQWTVTVLAGLFLLHGIWDVRALRSTTLGWFAPIRLTLTFLVFAAHFLVLVFVAG